MEKHIVIVGGGPAGVITALTAKKVYPEKTVCLIKEIGDGVIPCAIPYMMHTLDDPKQNVMGNGPLDEGGVETLVGKVIGLEPASSRITLSSGEEISYERLVLATGNRTGETTHPRY